MRTVSWHRGHTIPIAAKRSPRFGAHCRSCPLRSRCTTAKDGRVLHITEHDDELVAAINLRRLVNLGLDRTGQTWVLA